MQGIQRIGGELAWPHGGSASLCVRLGGGRLNTNTIPDSSISLLEKSDYGRPLMTLSFLSLYFLSGFCLYSGKLLASHLTSLMRL